MPCRDRAQIELWYRVLLWRVFLRERPRRRPAEHVQLRELERREADLEILVVQIEPPVLLEFLRRKNSIQQNPDRLRDLVRRIQLAAAVAIAFRNGHTQKELS